MRRIALRSSLPTNIAMYKGVPRNLTRGAAISCFVSTENIGEDQKKKKKVFTSFVVQFTSQNQVQTKKKKKGLTRSQVSCFHCFADCRCISAYISAGVTTAVPPPLMYLLLVSPFRWLLYDLASIQTAASASIDYYCFFFSSLLK